MLIFHEVFENSIYKPIESLRVTPGDFHELPVIPHLYPFILGYEPWKKQEK